MRITIDDHQLILAFHYDRVPAPVWSKYQSYGQNGELLGRRVTTVRVYEDQGKGSKLEDLDPLAEATVMQYAKDQDCKETARVEAMKRLFRNHRKTFSRAQSEQIWDQYHRRFPTIPWDEVQAQLGLDVGEPPTDLPVAFFR